MTKGGIVMTDNNMNLNTTPEQELETEQLEQVSGGGMRIRAKDGMLQPAVGGAMPASSSDSLKAVGGGLRLFPIGGAADDGEGSGMGQCGGGNLPNTVVARR
jgi:hypothetical protein